MDRDLIDIMAIGSDQAAALDKGFSQTFPIAQLLACKKHVEDNIKRKLKDLGIRDDAKKSILQDIFGSENKGEKGLVDSLSKDEFNQKLLLLQPIWDKRENKATKTKDPKIFNYFSKNIALNMKERMLLPLRRKAGLGDNFFFNNISESLNERIKKRIRQNKRDDETPQTRSRLCSLVEVADVYKEIAEECRRNIHRAIIDLGPYKLDDKVSHLKISAEKWRDMNDSEKDIYIKAIDPTYKPKKPERRSKDGASTKKVLGLFQESGLPSMFSVSWDKANEIIEREGVSKAPGTDKTRIVLSIENPAVPHLVTCCSDWKTIRCDCKRFERHSLCHHVLAVSYNEGTIHHIVSRWKANLSKQVNQGAPKNVGQKPGPKRHRHPPIERDVSGYTERTAVNAKSQVQEEKLFLIHLSKCKATTCYGCSGKYRESASSTSPLPTPPWDFVLRRKEFRVFNKKGTDILTISAKKEFAYYHLRKRCLLNKIDNVTSDDIVIEPDVAILLSRLHKNQLKKEFGIVLK